MIKALNILFQNFPATLSLFKADEHLKFDEAVWLNIIKTQHLFTKITFQQLICHCYYGNYVEIGVLTMKFTPFSHNLMSTCGENVSFNEPPSRNVAICDAHFVLLALSIVIMRSACKTLACKYNNRISLWIWLNWFNVSNSIFNGSIRKCLT